VIAALCVNFTVARVSLRQFTLQSAKKGGATSLLPLSHISQIGWVHDDIKSYLNHIV
jgi:hypothetical protein